MPRTLRRHRWIRLATAALTAGVVSLAGAGVAPAAQTFDVTTTSDHAPDNAGCTAADCTLREALAAAGAVGGADTINVPAGQYNLSFGELTLAGDNLVGAGRGTVIDAGSESRVLSVAVGAAAPLTSLISNVTITHGFVSGAGAAGMGGGIAVPSGTLQVLNSQLVENTATAGGAIGVSGSGALLMIGSTVAGNLATDIRLARGGGIANISDAGRILLGNVTVSGNRVDAPTAQGGGISMPFGPVFTLANVTVAGNTATEGGGMYLGPGTTRTISNTLVSLNAGGACAFASATALTTHNNLVQDNTCLLQGQGDVQGVADAKLLGLANNGGLTDTRAVAPGSLAIDKGSGCAASDQRGVSRPAAACDIGAFEYVAPKLTVTTTVVNDNGGTAVPSALSVHVLTSGGGDVTGSPQAGTGSGTTYVVDPGSYVVAAGGLSGYTVTLGGDCSGTGAVTVAENQAKSCTVVADDNAIQSTPPLPTPVAGKSANLVRPHGTVTIKLPGKKKFRVLKEDEQVPLGTTVNVKNGRITLIAAADKKGGTAEADFYDGIFKIGQTKGKKPITVLTLVEKLSCGGGGKATIAKKKVKKRRLWGDGHGHFRTKGKNSAATVLGTKWLVQDTCTTTLTKVARGRVSVRDFVKKKTVIVKKGHKYVARAR